MNFKLSTLPSHEISFCRKFLPCWLLFQLENQKVLHNAQTKSFNQLQFSNASRVEMGGDRNKFVKIQIASKWKKKQQANYF